MLMFNICLHILYVSVYILNMFIAVIGRW